MLLVIVIRFLFVLGWFVGDKVFTVEYIEACPKVIQVHSRI